MQSTHRESVDHENPFRPGGELSQEADEIVNLIKQGKPITPASSPVPPAAEDAAACTDPCVQTASTEQGHTGDAQPVYKMSRKEEKERKKAIKETKKLLANGIGHKVSDRCGKSHKKCKDHCKYNSKEDDVVEVRQVIMDQNPEYAQPITLPASDKSDKRTCCCGRVCCNGCCRCTLL